MTTKNSSPVWIIGTGALASLFAVMLEQAGIPILMTGTWKKAIRKINRTGILFTGQNEQPSLHQVRASLTPKNEPKAKLAIVLVKSWQTPKAAEILKSCLADDGYCVTLQNGFGNKETLQKALGKQRVLHGITTYGATLTAPAEVKLGGIGEIILQSHPHAPAFCKLMQRAGFDCQISNNFQRAFLNKIIVNAIINPLTAIWNITNGELLALPNINHIIDTMITEILHILRLEYHDFDTTTEEIFENIRTISKQTSGNRSSMLQDIDCCAPTEINFINGALVNIAKEHHIESPLNQAVVHIIHSLNEAKCFEEKQQRKNK